MRINWRRRLFWQLFLLYLVIIFLAAMIISGYTSRVLRQLLVEPTTPPIDRAIRSIRSNIILIGLALATLSAGVSFSVSRWISYPLREMKRGADLFARGELHYRLSVPYVGEAAELVEAMNQMASQLDSKIQAITDRLNEQDTILSSMSEGIIVIDSDERVVNLNRAAVLLLEVDLADVRGKMIHEIVRNNDLLSFVSQTLSSTDPTEGDIVFRNGYERYIQAHGTILRDHRGRRVGALIVLNEVTRLRRLENIRRDFVANVSHELKTPITAIHGSAETLRDGAIHDLKDAEHFLNIILNQTNRLNSIIEDLLKLSRIEEEAERGGIVLEERAIMDVLQTAIQVCDLKATERGIRIDLSCDERLQGRINHPLLEQAVVNLIDNAIKYSDPGSTVHVEAERTDDEIVISVQDHGPGIEGEHLSRLFERFYRIDRGRDRQLGGTGLGLAIVKHIARAHGGTVSVESSPGKGSTFRIHLPS
jgi:two-component system phosphate regulon sensor histidine kinase PhoR